MSKIRHILLDLGGVLYGVEYHRTTRALGLPDEELPLLLNDPMLLSYEKGECSTEAFIAHWQNRFPDFTVETLIDAWNAMLLGPLPEAEAVLQELSAHFSLALLSNTNDLHLSIVEPEILPWSRYFTDMFFSNRIHRRKPEPDTYQYVLRELGWSAHETLFIDDSRRNVEAAQAVGLTTYLLYPANQPLQLMEAVKGFSSLLS